MWWLNEQWHVFTACPFVWWKGEGGICGRAGGLFYCISIVLLCHGVNGQLDVLEVLKKSFFFLNPPLIGNQTGKMTAGVELVCIMRVANGWCLLEHGSDNLVIWCDAVLLQAMGRHIVLANKDFVLIFRA